MAEQPPIPFPQQNLIERLLANLATALRTQTNAILEIKAMISIVAERLDRIVDAERTEADDIREIRRAVIDTEQKVSSALHHIGAAREELKEISGDVQLPSPDELQHIKDVHRTSTAEAIDILFDRIKSLPIWLRWLTGTSIGGGIVEAIHRFFGHGGH